MYEIRQLHSSRPRYSKIGGCFFKARNKAVRAFEQTGEFAENYQSESLTVGHLDTGGYHLQLNGEDIFKLEVEEWKPIIK